MNRRSLLTTLLSSAAYLSSPQLCWGADTDVKVRFEWHLPSEQLSTAEKYVGQPANIEPEPHSETDTRGLPLLLIISAVALVPQIAEGVIRVYREYKNGGVIITSKGDGLDILTDTRLPANMIIVKDAQGFTVYQAKDPSADDLLSPLKSIIKGEK